MNKLYFLRKGISAFVVLAVSLTASMVSLASPGRMIAELSVSGKPVNGEPPFVYVNGEPARSGRSVFSSSTVTTTEDAAATIGIGKNGRIELARSSTANLIFDDKTVEAELTSGQLTVQGSLGTVKVRTTDGKTTILNAGESITASGEGRSARQSSSDDYWWVWLLVAGGAAAAIIIALSQSNDSNSTSPNR